MSDYAPLSSGGLDWFSILKGHFGEPSVGSQTQLAHCGLSVLLILAGVAMHHNDRLVPGLLHDLAVSSAIGRGLGHEARPE